jgi:hypothetical protein
MKKRSKILEKEREKLISQWKVEAQAEEAANREKLEYNRWDRRLGRHIDKEAGTFLKFLTWAEAFIANLPLTIGAIALANATLGVVWFKFAEENLESCQPVHFHSSQCNFPEFPGCFYCDKTQPLYQLAVNFHFACSMFGGCLALGFILKLILARRVVFDELSSPTTASPAGLICMTVDVVSAGRGFAGQVLVSVAGSVHLCLVIWFIYMALAYQIMPDPSWFPNTVSIGLSAVKVWLYYPMCGHFLMAVSLLGRFVCRFCLQCYTHFTPLRVPDFVIVELFLLSNQSYSRCCEQKDLGDCGLDANECSKCLSLRAYYNGSTFLPGRTPRYKRLSESASRDIYALHALLVFDGACWYDRELFQFMGSMERFQEDTILSRPCGVLRAYAVACKCNSGIQVCGGLILLNASWKSFQVVPLCVLGCCSRIRYHRHLLHICEVPLQVC